jgi:hypothetical protein
MIMPALRSRYDFNRKSLAAARRPTQKHGTPPEAQAAHL